jgi:two-component system LytT family sensor kinase
VTFARQMPDSRELTEDGHTGTGFSFRRILLAWTVYGCLISLQQDVAASINGYPIPLWMGFALQFPQAWIWAAFTPVILRLARRFPLRGPGWSLRLMLHVMLSGVCVFVAYLAYEIYLPWFPWPQNTPLVTRTLQLFAVEALADSMLYWIVLAIGHVQQEAARAAAQAHREVVLEEQLSRARLDALTLRLQPYFLFNTLHAISALVTESPGTPAV